MKKITLNLITILLLIFDMINWTNKTIYFILIKIFLIVIRKLFIYIKLLELPQKMIN